MESSTAELECIICLELPRTPINCTVCRKLMCQTHIERLANRCPNCRTEPLTYSTDEALKKRVYEERVKRIKQLPPDTKFKCKLPGCAYESHVNNMLLHHKYKHPEADLQTMLHGSVEVEAEVDLPTDKELRRAQYLSTRPPRAPEGDRSKIPNYLQALRMVRHVNHCSDEKCRQTWCGPWGSFIGGSQGDTHFDLTECPIGKSLNVHCGWNYADPRN